ncbi:MAG: ChbG/HpnK family deacetylase [Deltaproteobacteria bacterium]|nr:ChbG/HpnK family deacetylase [Deltaproteobacteria bacterium]
MSAPPIRIRITADDLGWSPEVNEGIARAVRAGTLSAVSVLATGPAFESGVGLLREALAGRPPGSVSVGLHLDLTDFRAVAEPAAIPSLVDGEGRFRRRSRPLMVALLTGAARVEHVALELAAQLGRLRAAGLAIGHLDGHRHAHLFPGLSGVVAGAARELAFVRTMPLRDPRPIAPAALPERVALALLSARLVRALGARFGARPSDAIAGLAEGRTLESDWIARTVRAARPGLTEIVTHPGVADSGTVGRSRGHDRSLDLAALTSPDLADALAERGVELVRGDDHRGCAS